MSTSKEFARWRIGRSTLEEKEMKANHVTRESVSLRLVDAESKGD